MPACGPTPAGGGDKIFLPGGKNNFVDDGFQCVELAERYLYLRYGWAPIDRTNGAELVKRYAGAHPSVGIVKNGTSGQLPAVGDVMSFSRYSDFTGTGHVAVVTRVYKSGTDAHWHVVVLGENQNIVPRYAGFQAGTTDMIVNNWTIRSFDKNTHIEWLSNGSGTWAGAKISLPSEGICSSCGAPVACVSPTVCVAGFSYAPKAGAGGARMVWGHGSSWSTTPVPELPKAISINVDSVACSSAQRCVAEVGDN